MCLRVPAKRVGALRQLAVVRIGWIGAGFTVYLYPLGDVPLIYPKDSSEIAISLG